MTSYDAQVIVVGGGPGGSSAAWHLAGLGLDVLVLDRARFPRDKTCAEYLSPEAVAPAERDGGARRRRGGRRGAARRDARAGARAAT
jgi:flavin-dependent dehydrogenase